MTKREILKIINKAKLNNVSSDDLASIILDLYEEKLTDINEELKELRSKKQIIMTLGEDLLENYPTYLSNTIDGHKAPARGLGGNKPQELWGKYEKDINNDVKRHEQIKNLIKWGEANNMIKVGYANFILSKDYLRLETEYLKQQRKKSDLI